MDEVVKCGICGGVKHKLKEATEKQNLPVFVCITVKAGLRMPCDGFSYRYEK